MNVVKVAEGKPLTYGIKRCKKKRLTTYCTVMLLCLFVFFENG